MSCIFGENRDIFFPKLSKDLHLMSFADIATKFLLSRGYEPYLCETEDEARYLIKSLPQQGKWPCLFKLSNTTGEKAFEEFYTSEENIDMRRFKNLGVIKNKPKFNDHNLNKFESSILELQDKKVWNKNQIVEQFFKIIPDFNYEDLGEYLDGKM